MKLTYRPARLVFVAPLAPLIGWVFLSSILRHQQNLLRLSKVRFAQVFSLATHAFMYEIRACISLNFSQFRFNAGPSLKRS